MAGKVILMKWSPLGVKGASHRCKSSLEKKTNREYEWVLHRILTVNNKKRCYSLNAWDMLKERVEKPGNVKRSAWLIQQRIPPDEEIYDLKTNASIMISTAPLIHQRVPADEQTYDLRTNATIMTRTAPQNQKSAQAEEVKYEIRTNSYKMNTAPMIYQRVPVDEGIFRRLKEKYYNDDEHCPT